MAYYLLPKTDWTVPDVVQTTDLNRIGTNLVTARQGGGQSGLPSVTWAEDLDIDMTNQTHYITSGGALSIKRIRSVNGTDTRNAGNIIVLWFSVGGLIEIGYSTSGDYAPITSSANITVSQWQSVMFGYSGAEWFPIRF